MKKAGIALFLLVSPTCASWAQTVVPTPIADDLRVSAITWSKHSGALYATFSIRNAMDRGAKDVGLECSFFGKSGTKIATRSITVFDIFTPKASKRVERLRIGYVADQVDSGSCAAVNYVPT